MAVKITIDHKRLSESPLGDSSLTGKVAFKRSPSSLAQEIISCRSATYLISGYRGAGKTSFIRQLEAEINTTSPETLFVYLNFAKFESHSILLRRLNRQFYHRYTSNPVEHIICQKMKNHEKTLKLFKNIYDRTYYEISRNSTQTKTEKEAETTEFKVSLLDFILLSIPILTLGMSVPSWALALLESNKWISGAISIASALGIIIQGFRISKKYTKEKANIKENKKSKFYDNEIAELHLTEILTAFKDEGCNIVFVLDELDKIDDPAVVEKLLNELKPTMLSGLATFIVVAGQNLYYDVHDSYIKDDHVLSSLFSRTHHVSLASPAELKQILQEYVSSDITQLPVEQKEIIDAYIDYLIFESKLVMRRLTGLIRQNLTWEGREAYLIINDSIEKLRKYSQAMGIVQSIRSHYINSRNFEDPIRDYLNMQLLIKAHSLINSDRLSFIPIEKPRPKSSAIPKPTTSINNELKKLNELLEQEFVNAGLIINPKTDQSEKVIDGKNEQKGTSEPSNGDKLNNKIENLNTNPDAILNEFQDFKRIMTGVYGELKPVRTMNLDSVPFLTIAKSFAEDRIIEIPGLNIPTVQSVLNNNKSFFDDPSTKADILNVILKHNFDFPTYINKTLFHYAKTTILKKITGYQLNDSVNPVDVQHDLILTSNDNSQGDLLFSIKFRRRSIDVLKDDFDSCLDGLKRYDNSTNKKNFSVLILFCDEGTAAMERLDFRFKQYHEDSFDKHEGRIGFTPSYIGNLKTLSRDVSIIYNNLVEGVITYADILLENQPPPREESHIDDHYTIATFDVTINKYLIKVEPRPVDKYWRLGLKFSSSNDFGEHTKRHFPGYPVIHLHQNTDSAVIFMTYYDREGNDPIAVETRIKQFNNNTFYFNVSYRDNKTVIDILDDGQKSIIIEPIIINNVYLFKVFAWADGHAPFKWIISVREEKKKSKLPVLRGSPSSKKGYFTINLNDSTKRPVVEANIELIPPSGTGTSAKTNMDGRATFNLNPSMLYMCLIAREGISGVLLREVDIKQDLIIELPEVNKHSGSILVKDENFELINTGRIKLFIKDGQGFLHSQSASIDGKRNQSVPIEIGESISAQGRNAGITQLTARYLDFKVSLIDYELTS